MFGKFGITELLVILGIAVLLFGNRLPMIGKSLGEGLKNFRKGLGGQDEGAENTQSDNAPASTQHTSTQQLPAQAQHIQENPAKPADANTTSPQNGKKSA